MLDEQGLGEQRLRAQAVPASAAGIGPYLSSEVTREVVAYHGLSSRWPRQEGLAGLRAALDQRFVADFFEFGPLRRG